MQQFCIYNQSNECFLSLGAVQGENSLLQLKKKLFARGAHHLVDEGCWFARPYGLHTLGMFAPRDLVYLDDQLKVIHVVESHPVLRLAPKRSGAASLLALPMHTVSSSQTKAGNQLLICAPEEMESRLRGIRGRGAATRPEPAVENVAIVAQDGESASVPAEQRRGKGSRSTQAFCLENGAQGVHLIRDISATGLYLVTRERWPVGSEVKMSLQRTGSSAQAPPTPVTLQMRVTRWGSDGVGLEFAGPPPEPAGLATMYVC